MAGTASQDVAAMLHNRVESCASTLLATHFRLRQRMCHFTSRQPTGFSTPFQISGRCLGFGLYALGDEPLEIFAIDGDGSFRAVPSGPARAPDKIDGHLR